MLWSISVNRMLSSIYGCTLPSPTKRKLLSICAPSRWSTPFRDIHEQSMKLLLRFESPVMLKGGSNPSMHGNGSCSRRRVVPIGGFLNELFLSVHLPNAYNIQALMHNSTILGRIRKFGQIYRFRDTDRTQPRLCVEPYSGAIWYHSGTKFFLRHTDWFHWSYISSICRYIPSFECRSLHM